MMTNERLNVTLPKDLARFVTSKVRSGEYDGKDDVIRDGLELLKSLEGYRAYKFQQLRDAMQVGIEQAEKGLCKPWDKRATERIKSKGRRLLAARKNGKI
jgi:putative addiction module CopG family antidote